MWCATGGSSSPRSAGVGCTSTGWKTCAPGASVVSSGGHQLPVWYCEHGHVTVAEDEPGVCCECGSTILTRDTDVLDTWFSSALWPFATWGWPEPTADLAAFYPTNLLSTAREIIFLWVARMVMMGLEFMDEVPFHDVYIHSVIQAPDGRRMSKSLGTGIDPLEMIEKYGADATRFALLLMSSSQDVRFSEEKIAMGRAFANKLWNASRLVLLASEGVEARRNDAHQVDRWITSRLQRCLEKVEGAVAVFDFADAVDALYHFVWDEFCDWYLELVKVRLYGDDEGQKAEAAGHARWVLDRIVRLLHPFLPFVTEEVAAQYGAVPLLEQEHPVADAALLSPADETAIADLQTALNALRHFRAEVKVPAGQVMEAVFVGEGGAGGFERYAPYVAALRTLARTDLRFGVEPEAGSTVILVPGGHFEVASTVDVAEELARLEQQLAKVEVEVGRCEVKLANEKFVGRAPEAVVAKEREKLAAHVADRDELAARIAQLRVG